MDQYQEYMDMAGLPSAYSPMMQYPAENLESMYPRCYHVIYPRVMRECEMMYTQYPTMTAPSREMIHQMTNRIYDEVEPMLAEDDMKEMDMQYMQNSHMDGMGSDYDMYSDTRQFGGLGGFGGGFFPGFFPRPRRRFLRDLISILLIRQLLRRRRPFFGF